MGLAPFPAPPDFLPYRLHIRLSVTALTSRWGVTMQLNAKIQAKQQEEHAQLKRERDDLDMHLMNNQMHSNEQSAERAENKCRTAIKSMSLLAASHEHALKGFADKSHKQHQALRKAQVDSGHYRSPRRPDKLLTFAFLIVVAALEGLMIALNIMAEGNGGLLTSFALGMLSGLLTAANGCACGFSSRWFGYGLAKSSSDSGDAFKRGFSKAVCLITAALGFFIIFAAARTRSNGGSHHDIFSFHETGFFETFNDGLNLMTFSIGLLGFGFAAWKGRHGFSDCVVELAEIADLKLDDIDIDARDSTFDAQEDVDHLQEAAHNALLVSSPAEDEENAINDKLIALSTSVEAAKQSVKLFAQKEYEAECFIHGVDVGAPELDFSDFDAVLDNLEVPPRTYPNQDLFDAVTAAHSCAIASITQSYADYQADVLGFRFPPPK